MVPCMYRVEGCYWLSTARTGSLQGAAWCLGWDVQAGMCSHWLTRKTRFATRDPCQGAPFLKSTILHWLSGHVSSGLPHGPAPWTLGSEALTANSHTCHFEDVSDQTGDRLYQLPVFSHDKSYSHHASQQTGGCSLFFQTEVSGVYLPWDRPFWAWRWL